MTKQPNIWGIHMGAHVASRPVDGGYVAIGWEELGDLRAYPEDREVFKKELSKYPGIIKAGAVPVHAGILLRFVYKLQAGDIVIYPSKHDRMVNIGRFTGESEYFANDPDVYPNQRRVEWLGSFPRTDFSQSALNEIGSAVTLFRVRRFANEFLAKVDLATLPVDATGIVDSVDEPTNDDSAIEAVSSQAEESTDDFIIRRIIDGPSGHQFEPFVAHLLECMGYTARVTQKSGDGGVDIIAHIDPLGFQPPIVKVQCKRTTSKTPHPDVDQLLGTLGEGG